MSHLEINKQNNLLRNTIIGSLFVLILGAALIIGIQVFNKDADAVVSGSNWQAGKIIDDGVFYNSNDMSVQDIQNFLNEKVPNCDTNGTQPATDVGRPDITHAQYAAIRGWAGPPYICLKNYYQVPRNDTVINNFGTNVVPAGGISSATIIKNAADTYGISVRALLVLLEKESANLLKDNWPVTSQYTNAMGFGCPDTAACDPQYAGFYNQISNAARQFKLYKNNPASYRYKPLQLNSIYYHPGPYDNANGRYFGRFGNRGDLDYCGITNVYISTYATAGLYNYTPYQPNTAALNNMYGTGDTCSSYGNRNFWRIFSDWFGDTKSYITNEATGDTFNIRNEANTYASGLVQTAQRSEITSAVCYQQGSDYFTNGVQGNTWIKVTTPANGWVPTDAALAQSIITNGNLPACNYSVTPVYRAYSPYAESHFWTKDPSEVSFVLNNLKFREGAPSYFAVNGGNYSGRPVWRLYNRAQETHFWTADPSERDFVKSKLGFEDEGYAYSVSYGDTGSKPVWRLYNRAQETHFWTADPSERDFVMNSLKFELEGQAFRIPQ